MRLLHFLGLKSSCLTVAIWPVREDKIVKKNNSLVRILSYYLLPLHSIHTFIDGDGVESWLEK